MTIPLSKLGITKEERHLLADRLNPEVNKIFLENMCKLKNIKIEDIEELDYENNEIFIMNNWCKRREQNARRNLPINEAAGTEECKYKTFDEAIEKDKISKHILLKDESDRGRYEPTQFPIEDEKEWKQDQGKEWEEKGTKL